MAGRPRLVSLPPEEMEKLGQEMVEWVKINKPIHLSMWYTQEKDFTDEQWDAFRKCPEFIHYYTKALKLVGYSYLDKDSNVDVRLKDRWQRVYFKDLKEEEDETARQRLEQELQLKNQQQQQGTEEQNKKIDQLCEEFRKAQSIASNAAASKVKSEDQS